MLVIHTLTCGPPTQIACLHIESVKLTGLIIENISFYFSLSAFTGVTKNTLVEQKIGSQRALILINP